MEREKAGIDRSEPDHAYSNIGLNGKCYGSQELDAARTLQAMPRKVIIMVGQDGFLPHNLLHPGYWNS